MYQLYEEDAAQMRLDWPRIDAELRARTESLAFAQPIDWYVFYLIMSRCHVLSHPSLQVALYEGLLVCLPLHSCLSLDFGSVIFASEVRLQFYHFAFWYLVHRLWLSLHFCLWYATTQPVTKSTAHLWAYKISDVTNVRGIIPLSLNFEFWSVLCVFRSHGWSQGEMVLKNGRQVLVTKRTVQRLANKRS